MPSVLCSSSRPGVDRLVVGVAVVLQLQEVVLAEDVAVPAGGLRARARDHLRGWPRRLAAVARAQRDQALGVLGQQRAIDARLVVVALEAGARDQLDQVLVAVEVLGQQDQVEVVAVLRCRLCRTCRAG